MPFIETALLGSEGADVMGKISGIPHCAVIRIRAVGSGELISTLYSADDIFTEPLNDITLANVNANVAEMLANFSEEKFKLRLETLQIDEVLKVNRITFFIASLWASLPG